MIPSPVIVAAANSIEWTDRSWQPGVWGCQLIDPCCQNCYAMKMAHRQSAQGNYPKGITKLGPKGTGAQWTGLVLVATEEQVRASAAAKLPKRPREDGRNWRIFTTSMGDLFHKDVPFWWLDVVFEEMTARPWIDFQVLTKRADRMAAYDADRKSRGLPWPSNAQAGVTCGTQKGADARVPDLLKVRAAVRFLSMEPLLTAVDLDQATCQYCGGFGNNIHHGHDGSWCTECESEAGFGAWLDPCADKDQPGINWVICGTESGTHRRPTDTDWIRAIRDQCSDRHVAFFLKQANFGNGIESLPLLDGRQWAEFPETA